jgi:hypothetical protein
MMHCRGYIQEEYDLSLLDRKPSGHTYLNVFIIDKVSFLFWIVEAETMQWNEVGAKQRAQEKIDKLISNFELSKL